MFRTSSSGFRVAALPPISKNSWSKAPVPNGSKFHIESEMLKWTGHSPPVNGQFTDAWSINSDLYAPIGCGFNIQDQWDWIASPAVFKELGGLVGYIHTNSIEINLSITPPAANAMPAGTVIPK